MRCSNWCAVDVVARTSSTRRYYSRGGAKYYEVRFVCNVWCAHRSETDPRVVYRCGNRGGGPCGRFARLVVSVRQRERKIFHHTCPKVRVVLPFSCTVWYIRKSEMRKGLYIIGLGLRAVCGVVDTHVSILGRHGIYVSIGYRIPPLDMGPCARRHRSDAILGRGAGTSTIRVIGLGLRAVCGVVDTHVSILGGTAYMLVLDIDYHH